MSQMSRPDSIKSTFPLDEDDEWTQLTKLN